MNELPQACGSLFTVVIDLFQASNYQKDKKWVYMSISLVLDNVPVLVHGVLTCYRFAVFRLQITDWQWWGFVFYIIFVI
ncbi:hypothetical protein M2459_000473 [Parabacteroides sp. PF5-5]|uniref:hypothetical protein n=1 Tax=unclassified Parabacteroides TaxID=2649774 RepID=UPI0024752105|nr:MULTISPECIES: hypothetical protein [unclassified Parabacteroides]MDH6303593.1 hypothetical protein [Parabacteroides sp. PH5-39]MDH6314915.1 hypothetical protein [Parabacteroides sp. PF5-13]MDH6318252.1 hypothetical protein [Parabacteroides sp. PH5-13]MDH6321815.1 hypothetical protein [Parabacteroides sp. PH5-8]MDH6325939.1 hypothetical protein [Parabacteroides sp. PH5-41]